MKRTIAFKIIALLGLIISLKSQDLKAQAPGWEWAKSAGGNGYDFGSSIVVDNLGNSIITGAFIGTISFGSIQLASHGGNDIFIVKYDPAGNVVWAKNAGGFGNDYGNDISLDASGNCYITGNYGYYTGIVTFDTIQLNSNTSRSGFLAKLNANGDFQWVMRGLGKFSEWKKVATDQAGNSFVTGVFADSLLLGSFTLVSTGLNDIFIVSFNTDGKVTRARNIESSNHEYSPDIAIDTTKNIFLTGGSYDASMINFDGIIPSGSFSNQDLFFAKLDSSWNIEWAYVARGGQESFTSTDNPGNSYLMGVFNDSIRFGNYTFHGPAFISNNGFVVKFSPNGSIVWARSFTSSINMYLRDIAADALCNVYFTGMYYGSLTFGSSSLNSVSGGGDVLIAKLDSSGNPMWAKGSGTSQNDQGNSIAVDGTGNCYLTGRYGDSPAAHTINFDSTSLTSNGLTDIFIAKLSSTSLTALSSFPAPSFALFPNPAHSQVRLTNLSQPSRCTLYNILGQVVFSEKLSGSTTESFLSLQGITPGIYSLRVHSAYGVQSSMLVVE